MIADYESVSRYIARNSNVAMLKWRFLTMAPIVITEVQRVFRGFLGRLDAGILKKLHEAAITVVSRQPSRE